MKIGITTGFASPSIWSNGINQNGIYLYKLLEKLGHSIYLIHPDELIQDKYKVYDVLKKNEINCKAISISKSFKKKWDVIIKLSLTVEESHLDFWKLNNKNCKLISYECGNNYIIDAEKIIFNAHNGDKLQRKVKYAKPDQIWFIPQHEEMVVPYFKFKAKCKKATTVPFIWDSSALEINAKLNNLEIYKPRSLSKIAIMEPNKNIIKNCIYPLLLIDDYLENNNLEKVYIVNGVEISKNPTFNNFVSELNSYKKGILTAEYRVQTHKMLNDNADLIVSWQWGNPLNYFYLDVAYLGFPIIHNGKLCKDLGYYYEHCNLEEGTSQLKNAIENHNNDKDYLERNRNIIKRYTIENKEMVENYKILLEDLVNNKFTKRKYNWKTNTID